MALIRMIALTLGAWVQAGHRAALGMSIKLVGGLVSRGLSGPATRSIQCAVVVIGEIKHGKQEISTQEKYFPLLTCSIPLSVSIGAR